MWLPYLQGRACRRSTTRICVRASTISTSPPAPIGLERAAYEASGFVVRRMLDMAGVDAATESWRAGVVAGCSVVCGDRRRDRGSGGHRGRFPRERHSEPSYLARMAAGLETDLDGADRWAKVGRRIEPDAEWVAAARQRYDRFLDCLPFDPGAARPKRG